MSPPLSMSPVLTVHCMVSYISVFCSLALKKLQFTAASKILRPGNDRGYASRLCTIDCCEKTATTKGVNFSHLPIRKVIRARLLYFRSIFPFPYFGFRTSEFSTCPKCTLASPCTLGVDVYVSASCSHLIEARRDQHSGVCQHNVCAHACINFQSYFCMYPY